MKIPFAQKRVRGDREFYGREGRSTKWWFERSAICDFAPRRAAGILTKTPLTFLA
jgi:hypothetical protein